MQAVASLRASDSDREQVAERLRHATAEGRLSGDELAQRLEVLFAARTFGELDALVADLPVNRSPVRPRVRRRRVIGAVSAVMLVLGALVLLVVVAMMRVHTAVGVLGPGDPRRLTVVVPVAGPHQGLMIGALLVPVVVGLVASAALLWALMDSRSRRQR